MFKQINKTIIAILHLKNALHVVLCTKKLHFLARTGVRKISSVACGFSPFKIHFSDYTERLISRINEVYVFFNKISLSRNWRRQFRLAVTTAAKRLT